MAMITLDRSAEDIARALNGRREGPRLDGPLPGS